MKLNVIAFRPTQYGNLIKTNEGNFYVNSNLGQIEAGMQLECEKHSAGDAYPKSFGVTGSFKTDGIHDVFIVKSRELALRTALKSVNAEEI